MKIKIFIAIIFALHVVSMPGCKKSEIKTQLAMFDRSLDSYSAALRWARYGQAARFHITEDGEAILVDLKSLEDIAVTSVRLLSKKKIPNTDSELSVRIHISAEIDYFHKQQSTLKKTQLTQQWWYDKKQKLWLTDSDFPEFK